MPVASAPLVLVAAALCLGVICLWVRRTYGTSAAVVPAALGALSLLFVYLNYEVFSFDQWRAGSLWRTLLVFAVPAVAATIVTVTARQRSSPTRKIALLTVFWLGPALVLYVSQRPVGPSRELGSLAWWVGSSVAIYVGIPVIFAVLARDRIRSYGLSLAFVRTEASLFLMIVPVIAALAWLVAEDARFQAGYPFLRGAPEQTGIGPLLAFEVMYGLSFVALEFYFRGFMVHAGTTIMGIHSVPVMALFYCLLHMGKPMPECTASLIGGLILGYVSLRLKSIVVGVAAHITLAWGVDAAVIAQRP